MRSSVLLAGVLLVSAAASQVQHTPEALTGAEIENLRERKYAVNEAQGRLRGSVSSSMTHLSDLAHIKHALAVKAAQLRNEKHKAHVLQDNIERVERAHARIMKSVHKTLDPEVDASKVRLEKKQDVLQSEQEATRYWAKQEKRVKLETKEAIKDEEAADKRLRELNGQMSWEKRQEAAAEEKFAYKRQMAQEDVKSLEFAGAQFDAEQSRLAAAQKEVKDIELKVNPADNIRSMEQVEDARRALRIEGDEMQTWKDNLEHVNLQASEMMKENSTAYSNLLEIQAQLAWTKQEQHLAKKQYAAKKKMANQEIESLKYVDTKYTAEASNLKGAEAAVESAEKSLHKLNAIRDGEEQKVKRHLAFGKNKLQNKMKKLEKARDQTVQDIGSLENEYSRWQQDQQQLREDVARSKQASEAASDAYEDRQQDAFYKAQAKVYQDQTAFTGDGWNGVWASES